VQQLGWNQAVYMGTRASQELELLTHNMANASTPGFKRELLRLWRQDSPNEPADSMGQKPAYFLNVRHRDHTQGTFHTTGNENDFALDGPGYFKVETPQGVRYTRNGQFRLNAERQLVTREGYMVQGKSGPISLNANDQNFYVDPEGGVHMDKSLGDQFAVVDFPNPHALKQQGGSYYAASPEAGQETEAPNTKVRQGEVEESNFDPSAEMVQLMNVHRSFDAYMKVLDTFAAKDRKVIEEIGTL